jgi:hypothetical protein
VPPRQYRKRPFDCQGELLQNSIWKIEKLLDVFQRDLFSDNYVPVKETGSFNSDESKFRYDNCINYGAGGRNRTDTFARKGGF